MLNSPTEYTAIIQLLPTPSLAHNNYTHFQVMVTFCIQIKLCIPNVKNKGNKISASQTSIVKDLLQLPTFDASILI